MCRRPQSCGKREVDEEPEELLGSAAQDPGQLVELRLGQMAPNAAGRDPARSHPGQLSPALSSTHRAFIAREINFLRVPL